MLHFDLLILIRYIFVSSRIKKSKRSVQKVLSGFVLTYMELFKLAWAAFLLFAPLLAADICKNSEFQMRDLLLTIGKYDFEIL